MSVSSFHLFIRSSTDSLAQPGDAVVVINAKDIKMEPYVAEKRKYYYHTQYPGGLKVITASELMKTNPGLVKINIETFCVKSLGIAKGCVPNASGLRSTTIHDESFTHFH